MKIKGRLIFKSEEAGEMVNNIARSLAPDNVSEIQTFMEGDSVIVAFSADKVGTMLSSVDDYLMNAKIAEDMLKKVKRL